MEADPQVGRQSLGRLNREVVINLYILFTVSPENRKGGCQFGRNLDMVTIICCSTKVAENVSDLFCSFPQRNIAAENKYTGKRPLCG